ncbi:S8 family peptidase [Cellulomonas soli]|uniref:Extracellular protease n=1 Tax=Cellulomonas soli TaxID=931535 RepID=A0A512PEG6_9CELL|nr:S8 family peptidase [Cellulomonas soli]NYI58900.1 serine protease [Cellulomonas soli]GEP69607.1 extracellular protease [Cellulomonas soli]
MTLPTHARAAAAVAVGLVLASTTTTVALAAVAAPGAAPGTLPAAAPAAVAPAAPADPGTTDRLIVKYRGQTPGSTPGATVQTVRGNRIEDAAAPYGAGAEHVRDTTQGAQVWSLGKDLAVTDVQAIAAQVAADPTVEYAEPDRLLQPLAAAPDDTRWADQWDLKTTAVGLDVLTAWDTTRGAGVNVAVIDTGYRPHADVAANIVGGYDLISDTTVSNDGNGRDTDASDPGDWTTTNQCASGWTATNSSWHGTHVAGTIAAVTGNGLGVAGIAPAAKVVPVRVLGRCGGYTSDIADAMVWASGGTVSGVPANANPARVLNLSLGGSGTCDTTSQNAITAARANGAVVVVAAGNSNTNVSGSSPANCSGVVAVAAYGPTGARAYYSNYGTLVDLAAPGGDTSGGSSNGILSTLNTGTTTPGSDTYAYYQGTSMATPHVAAVAALMISANPSLTPDQVETLLKSSAQPFVATCTSCGAGMLDAATAVAAAVGGTTPTPTPTPTPTTPAGTIVESEANNSRATADPATRPSTFTGTIGSSSDTDYVSVPVPAGATLTVTLTAGVSTADYDLYLYNSSGTRIATSTYGAGQVDTVTYTNSGTASATYYARVLYYSGATGTTGTYTLAIS